jgi:hypothetical protein
LAWLSPANAAFKFCSVSVPFTDCVIFPPC